MLMRGLAAALLTLLVGGAARPAAQPGRLVIVGGALAADNESVYRAILDGRLGKGPLCVFPTASATPDSAMASPVANFDKFGGEGTAKGVFLSVSKPETARDPAVVRAVISTVIPPGSRFARVGIPGVSSLSKAA